MARRLSHRIAAAPDRTPLRLLAPLRSRLRGEVDVDRLLEILDVLDGAGIAHWLAGGWGVDALAGHQTRRHDDADLVIGDFDQRAPLACAALAAIGFELVERHHQPVWMPDQWILEDRGGASIDLVSLTWARLRRGGGEDPSPAEVFVVGALGDRPVPCLSATTQRLFHSGFELRSVHRRDLEVLA
ncbi:MAG: nucleotidyltransferase domain-containing protein [Acidimicrobiales bacterium]